MVTMGLLFHEVDLYFLKLILSNSNIEQKVDKYIAKCAETFKTLPICVEYKRHKH